MAGSYGVTVECFKGIVGVSNVEFVKISIGFSSFAGAAEAASVSGVAVVEPRNTGCLLRGRGGSASRPLLGVARAAGAAKASLTYPTGLDVFAFVAAIA